MQFDTNSDYPDENFGARPHKSFASTGIDRCMCDRYHTNVIFAGKSQVCNVIVPRPRPIRTPTQARNNRSGDYDDSNDSSDSDSDEDEYGPPSRYAFWIERKIKEAIYGQVALGVIIRRLDQPELNENGERVEWKATRDRCAIKIYSLRSIAARRGSAEDPIGEISAMQYLMKYQEQRFQQGEPGGQGMHKEEQIFQLALDNSFETNVMMPLEVYTDNASIYSVMPYMDGGELFDVLDGRQRFPEAEARFWMVQILKGVETLQRAGICHRDLSLENLLTDSSGRVLIIDMGMCIKIPYVDDLIDSNAIDLRTFEDHRERQRCLIRADRACGKPYYISPEIRRSRSPFDGHAIDMWALGPILFLMCAGFPPWEIADNSDERFYFFSRGYLAQHVTSWNLGFSADLTDLLQRMFLIDPKDRLSLDQVRAHPWMQGERQPPPPPET